MGIRGGLFRIENGQEEFLNEIFPVGNGNDSVNRKLIEDRLTALGEKEPHAIFLVKEIEVENL